MRGQRTKRLQDDTRGQKDRETTKNKARKDFLSVVSLFLFSFRSFFSYCLPLPSSSSSLPFSLSPLILDIFPVDISRVCQVSSWLSLELGLLREYLPATATSVGPDTLTDIFYTKIITRHLHQLLHVKRCGFCCFVVFTPFVLLLCSLRLLCVLLLIFVL